jgi:hypothetical protein
MSPAAPPPSPAPSRIVSPRDRQLPSTVRVTRNPVSVIRLQAPRKHKRPVWTVVVAAYLVAAPATPAGISGAVLLLPFQVSVLGTPSPPVNPTNLLYNVVATPGALYLYWRQADRRTPGPGAHHRFGHPRRAGPRPARVRPGGRRRPGPAREMARRDPARFRRQPGHPAPC